MTSLLSISNVSMCFAHRDVLSDVSFDVAPGERVALLGHNGAGKTTLFRIILGFLSPSDGQITINGAAPGTSAARNTVSYLPESVSFPKLLTGRETVAFYAKLKGVAPAAVDQVLDDLDLTEAADQRCGTYSKGMRQRLGLAQAMLGDPKLLLLDEPTSGLDPLARQRFYHLISKMAERGTAVLLSSHGLSEIEARTDRVAILRKGKLVADAPLTDLQHSANLPLRIRVQADTAHVDTVHQQMGGQRINGATVELECRYPEKMQRLTAISALGTVVRDVEVYPPSLDDIYRHYSADTETRQ
jgi:Cu-processing system ATP-binding protein